MFLYWDENIEPDFESYKVYRKVTGEDYGEPLITDLKENNYLDTEVENNIVYYYQVKAVDEYGNISEPLEVYIEPDDFTPPASPTGLSAREGDEMVILNWDENKEPDLDSYNIYRSTSSGKPYDLIADNINVSEYTDNNVVNDTTYYYVVTAVDTAENESKYSNEVSATPEETVLPDGILAHYDASQIEGYEVGDTVSTWNDLSGNGLDAIQEDELFQPELIIVDGIPLPVLNIEEHDAGSKGFDIDFGGIEQPIHFFGVVSNNCDETGWERQLFDRIGDADRYRLSWSRYNYILMWDGDSWMDSVIETEYYYEVEQLDVITAIWNGENSLIRVNGENEETGSQHGDIRLTNMRLPEWSSDSGQSMNGYLGEVVIFSGELSEEEIDLIEKYLMDKWGI